MQLKELFHNFSYRRLLVIKILFSWEKGHNIRFMGSGRFFTHSGAVTLIAPLKGRDHRINTQIYTTIWLNVTDIHRDIFTPSRSSAINSILNSDIYIPQSQDVHIDAISWVFDQYGDIFCCNAMDRLILQRWKAQCHPLTFLQSFITGDTLECILCTWLWSNMLA